MRTTASSRCDRSSVIMVVMLVVLLIPVWGFHYFPSADGPSHLANALILRDYYLAGGETYHAYYTVHLSPIPNWFAPLMLAGMTMVLPAMVAEKVLLSAIVVGLPMAMAYVIRGINRRSAWVALLSLPLVYSYVFYMGFHNFLFSVIFLLLAMGWWWRRRNGLHARHVPVLMGLALLVYFSHPIGAVLMGLILVGWSVWLGWVSGRDEMFRRQSLARVGWTMLGLLPMASLLAYFLLAGPSDGETQYMGLVESLRRLVTLDVMISHHLREFGPALAMVSVLGACGVWTLHRRYRCRRGIVANDAFALTCLGLLVVYFFAPEQTAGGGFITLRLILILALTAILWLATSVYPQRWRRRASTVAVVATVVLLAMQLPVFIRVNDYADAYLTVERHLRPDTTLLPLAFAGYGTTPDGRKLSRRVRLFDHLAAYPTMQHAMVNLYNYEAKTGYFPIGFQPTLNPFGRLWLRVRPPMVDLHRYITTTPGRVDYLLIWGTERDLAKVEQKALLEDYKLVYRCPRHGVIWLYEHCPTERQ